MLCRHASIRSAAAIAYEVASDDFVSRNVGTTYFTAMGPGLDDFVANLLHTITQFLEQFLITAKDPRVRHRDGLENAEHDGAGGRDGRVVPSTMCGFAI